LKTPHWLFRMAPFLDGRNRKRPIEPQADANRDEPTSSPATGLQPTSPTEPACPTCGAAMFKRFNRQTSQMFWGCTHYPRCKGTRPV